MRRTWDSRTYGGIEFKGLPWRPKRNKLFLASRVEGFPDEDFAFSFLGQKSTLPPSDLLGEVVEGLPKGMFLKGHTQE